MGAGLRVQDDGVAVQGADGDGRGSGVVGGADTFRLNKVKYINHF